MEKHNVYLASKPRYEILDGLRGVAAVLVVLFHIFETYSKGPAYQIINHGYLAVDFFFVLSGFVILSYYSVVAGWTAEYTVLAVSNSFAGKTTADFPTIFADFVSNPWKSVMWMAAFMVVTHIIVVRGVKSGIEKFSKVMMPALFVIIVVLAICSVMLPGASEGLEFLLKPDFSKITGSVVLNAMGQAFFSLSLGLGCLCTYASYFRSDTDMGKTALNVSIIDTFVAIMSGFIIFPAVFNAGYTLDSSDIGPSLLFITLPNVFGQAFGGMPALAYGVSVLFYFLLVVAALPRLLWL